MAPMTATASYMSRTMVEDTNKLRTWSSLSIVARLQHLWRYKKFNNGQQLEIRTWKHEQFSNAICLVRLWYDAELINSYATLERYDCCINHQTNAHGGLREGTQRLGDYFARCYSRICFQYVALWSMKKKIHIYVCAHGWEITLKNMKYNEMEDKLV